ncbi:MAG TPA: flagellar basal body-associated FliL family protein [Actinomycetota bacterium]|nr:flagellar basal body-associated FliL family protein [Actinomycetota bacterium]
MAMDIAAAQEGATKKKGKGKLVAIVVVAMLIGGVGAKFTVLSSGGKAGKPKLTPSPTPTPPGQVIDLGDLTINLAEPSRYALVGLAVELGKTADPAAITTQMPLLKDAGVRRLSGIPAATLMSLAGQDQVRAELTDQAQQIFGKEKIVRVLLTEVLVQ